MKQRTDTEIHRLGQDSELITRLNVTIQQRSTDRLNLNNRGETDNWRGTNKRQEKLVRLTKSRCGRLQVGAEFRMIKESTWH